MALVVNALMTHSEIVSMALVVDAPMSLAGTNTPAIAVYSLTADMLIRWLW